MTLSRARSIVPRNQIVAVIDRAQKLRWSESLAMLPGGNVIAQPHHRGSAIEVLLAALTMLERDPSARIIAMPTDHYVSNETALASSLLDAATPTAHTRNNLALIGIKPEQPATESGYIVPGRWFEDGTRSVLRIVKPSGKVAASDLIARGALWDSAIVAARAPVLVEVAFARACRISWTKSKQPWPGATASVCDSAPWQGNTTRLPSVDLSYVAGLGAAEVGRVITSRSCGPFDFSPQRNGASDRPSTARRGGTKKACHDRGAGLEEAKMAKPGSLPAPGADSARRDREGRPEGWRSSGSHRAQPEGDCRCAWAG